MKISTRGRYGTRILLDLGLQDEGTPTLLKDIADRQQIPLPYLEQLVRPLVAAGFVRSTKGPNGGIYLNKKPSEIKLLDVIQLFEGSMAPVDCVDNPDLCERSSTCVTRDVWTELRDAMNEVLESTTLQGLIERHEDKNSVLEAMYYI
jgi:Rrf2 family protein